MEMITLKQYAENQKITYEAVRRQVVRYKKELEGHIVVNQRVQYLDQEAVEFLNKKRRESPIILMQQNLDEELTELQQQADTLRNQLLEAQNQLLASKDRIIELQNETRQALEAKQQYDGLLTMHEQTKADLEEAREQIAATQTEKTQAEQERDAARQQLDELETNLKSVMEDLQAITADLQAVKAERDAAKQEAESYTPSFFGFYRKRTPPQE